MLDKIAEWLVAVEKGFIPLKRFIDFTHLTAVAITTDRLFEFPLERVGQFPGTAPVRSALFCDEWVGFGVARLYEAVMARAFQDLAKAAEWLAIPVEVLTLKDEPAPLVWNAGRKS